MLTSTEVHNCGRSEATTTYADSGGGICRPRVLCPRLAAENSLMAGHTALKIGTCLENMHILMPIA